MLWLNVILKWLEKLHLALFYLKCYYFWFNDLRLSIIRGSLLWHPRFFIGWNILYISSCFSLCSYRHLLRHPDSRHWCIWCRFDILSFGIALQKWNLFLDRSIIMTSSNLYLPLVSFIDFICSFFNRFIR